MSAFGSSTISKSSKKLAPKAPIQRRRPISSVSQPTPRASSEGHRGSHTTQPSPSLVQRSPSPTLGESLATGEEGPQSRGAAPVDHLVELPGPAEACLPQEEPNLHASDTEARPPTLPQARKSSISVAAQRLDSDPSPPDINADVSSQPSEHERLREESTLEVVPNEPVVIAIPVSRSRVEAEPGDRPSKRRRIEQGVQEIPSVEAGSSRTSQVAEAISAATVAAEAPSVSSRPPIAGSQAQSSRPSKKKRASEKSATKRRTTAEGDGAAAHPQPIAPGSKRIQREETPEDAETIDIVPSIVKMADLCRDIGTGKKSKRERELQKLDWTEIVTKQRDRKARRERGELPPKETVDQRLERAEREREIAQQGGAAAPQMRIVNGQIVLDDQSLHIDRHANAVATAEEREEIEENALTHRVTAGSWMRREKTEPWDEELTERFYQGLRMFGTDFMIISGMFPGRTRRQIKLKFCKEERLHPDRINEALLGPKAPMDLAEYSRHTNTEYADPAEFHRELEEEVKQHESEQTRQREVQEATLLQRKADATGEDHGDMSTKENENQEGSEGILAGTVRKGKRTGPKKKKGLTTRASAAEEVEILGTIEDVARREIATG